MSRSTATVTPSVVRDAVDRALGREPELVLDPDFFAALDDFTGLEVLVKDGQEHNELTRHRYDVVLSTTARTTADPAPEPVLRWGSRSGPGTTCGPGWPRPHRRPATGDRTAEHPPEE